MSILVICQMWFWLARPSFKSVKPVILYIFFFKNLEILGIKPVICWWLSIDVMQHNIAFMNASWSIIYLYQNRLPYPDSIKTLCAHHINSNSNKTLKNMT